MHAPHSDYGPSPIAAAAAADAMAELEYKAPSYPGIAGDDGSGDGFFAGSGRLPGASSLVRARMLNAPLVQSVPHFSLDLRTSRLGFGCDLECDEIRPPKLSCAECVEKPGRAPNSYSDQYRRCPYAA